MKRLSKRTDRVKYVDPATGITEYRYVEKVTYRYDEEDGATGSKHLMFPSWRVWHNSGTINSLTFGITADSQWVCLFCYQS